MAKTFKLPIQEPLLDIVSYGRGGPCENGGRLTTAQVEHIRRTVQRAPEVVVKVLSRASSDLGAAGKHLDYISRSGTLGLETDDGDQRGGRVGMTLLSEWDLDIDDARRQSALAATRRRQPPKLIHKLMFSMPPGTASAKVLAAVRNFARDEFWGQHRYALVLHTDEAHPHVHLVLKAVSEQGARLNIKKATLRHWRSQFAHHLRILGVSANATERAVRGESRKAKKDGIYRASLRGDSNYLRAQAEAAASALLTGDIRVGHGVGRLAETRTKVVDGWLAVARLLSQKRNHELAGEVMQFARQMRPAWTEQQWVAHDLREHLSGRRDMTRGLGR